MHDVFGKPIRPFDRVRAATREELDAAGKKGEPVETLSPAEKVVVTCNTSSPTCNVVAIDEIDHDAAIVGTPGGRQIVTFVGRGGGAYLTAGRLAIVDRPS